MSCLTYPQYLMVHFMYSSSFNHGDHEVLGGESQLRTAHCDLSKYVLVLCARYGNARFRIIKHVIRWFTVRAGIRVHSTYILYLWFHRFCNQYHTYL